MLLMSQTMFLQTVAFIHATYFALTGIWPLVHMPSFLKVTGPKTDLWLVRTVGVLVTAIAIPIFTSAINRRITSDILYLAILSALGLTIIDVVYVARRVISKIYLLDAAAEVILIVAWLLAVGAKG